jgi:ubiquitin-protein ligase
VCASADIEELESGDVAKVEWPDASNLMRMKVTITPDSGLWLGGKYEFEVEIPSLYPHNPPKVRCLTPIYHPNIDNEGAVCLNILRKDWRPVLDLNAVIYGMTFLFYEPNGNDPLNHGTRVRERERGGGILRERRLRAFSLFHTPHPHLPPPSPLHVLQRLRSCCGTTRRSLAARSSRRCGAAPSAPGASPSSSRRMTGPSLHPHLPTLVSRWVLVK